MGYVVVVDPQTSSIVKRESGSFPQYVLVVDDRPDPLVVMRQVGPSGAAIMLPTGPPGLQGPPGLSAYELAVEHGFSGTLEQYLQMQRGFILLAPGADTPPTGTYDSTWVYQEVEGA